jgi:tetratricopeptide (TPR) repeat protein
MRQTTDATQRESIAVALGPVLAVLIFACFRLGWWNPVDGLLLTLLIATTMAIKTRAKSWTASWLWMGSLVLILTPGFLLLLAPARTETRNVTENEVLALIERDLAYSLARQAAPDGAVVLAPPSLTTSLYFHGGLTGLGTPYWENKDGFTAAVRIAGATSLDEAQAASENRNLKYIIVPSWDPFMDEYARLGSGHPEHSLFALLQQWQAPRWLQPVPYHVPKIAGFEGLSVAIFQVVDLQDNPTALGRLAEYFVEMGKIDQAEMVSQALARLFPADLGALVARTLVAKARNDDAGFAEAIKELPAHISRGEDNALPWQRRVSLAIALAEIKRFDLARNQIKQCLAELDEPRIRSLMTISLYRLQVLSKAFGLEIVDPRLRVLSRKLLPVELRANL